MIKFCSTCRRWAYAEEVKDVFAKDACQRDGFDCVCKECRRNYRIKNRDKELARWKRYYKPGTTAYKRLLVRAATRRKWGPASKQECSFCEGRAEEWHHLDYKWFAAIPLCQNHHHEFGK